MADKEFATVTDSPELTGSESVLLLQGSNTREATYDLMARYIRGSQINDQTGSYTTVLNDAGKTVRMDVGTANNLTIPPNSSVAYKIGTRIWVTQIDVGTTTIVEGAGVTINTSGTLILGAQWQPIALLKVATDEWDLTKAANFVLGDVTDVDLATTAQRKRDTVAWDGTNFVPVGHSGCRLSLKAESYTDGTGKIATWTEDEDTDSYFGGGTVADEGVIIPFTGRYRMSYLLGFEADNDTEEAMLIFIRLNRTGAGQFNDFPKAALINANDPLTTTLEMFIRSDGIIFDATVSDEIDLFIRLWHTSGTRDSIEGYWDIEYMGVTP